MKIQIFEKNKVTILDTEINTSEDFEKYNLNKEIYDKISIKFLNYPNQEES